MENQEERFAILRNALDEMSDDDPIPWYKKVERVYKSFTAKTYKKRNVKSRVYIILLENVGKQRRGYALYIGKTARQPETRFREHQAGNKVSKYVKKYGVRLLPELFAHLNPMGASEATELEVSITEALKKAGVPTFGGH